MNNMTLLLNALLIKESNGTSLMTLTLTDVQDELLDMLFQRCFCG